MSVAAAPTATRATGSRLRAPLLTGLGVVAGTVALHVRDPHVSGSWGVCPVSFLVGLDCPGCGSLRAVNLLGRGDLAGAASSNLLLVLAAPVAVVAWVLWVRRAAGAGGPRRGPTTSSTTRVAVAVLLGIVVAAFTVLRNLPAGAWLHS